MRKLLFFTAFSLLLIARENPFEPVEATQNQTDYRAIPPQQITKESIELPPSSRIIKSISITHQEVDGSINKIDKKIEKTVDWHTPIEISQSDANKLPRVKNAFLPVESLEDLKEIAFFVQGDTLKLETKNELYRDFFLPRPSRIVLDFNSSTPIEPTSAVLEGAYFTNISVTFHGTFFRVEITLDSYYPYKISPIKDGFLLGLN